jgi:crossover junction endodeoxyribonuclease RusA
MFEALLPLPPSVNAAYRAISRGRIVTVIKSQQYREWEKEAARALEIQFINKPTMKGRLSVEYRFEFPDKRRRDIGNFEKALSDFLEAAGVYENDCQIDEMRLVRGEGGDGVFVTIREVASV